MPEEPHRIHIDFNKLLGIAQVGVRRAAGFMTLGLRAANDQTVTNLNLVSNFSIRFFPEDPGEPVIRDVQEHFSEWIVANGLRELEQYFSAFLDELYLVLSLMDADQRTMPFGEVSKKLKRFNDDTNLASKLNRIASEYGIASNCAEHFSNISRARNVLTHNLGIVAERHKNSDSGFRMTWRAKDLKVGGTIINKSFEPFSVGDDGSVKLVIVDRERTFTIGSKLALTPHELSEICMMFGEQAAELVKSAQAKALSGGIIVETTPSAK